MNKYVQELRYISITERKLITQTISKVSYNTCDSHVCALHELINKLSKLPGV